MRVDPGVTGTLDLFQAAGDVVLNPLHQLPHLISDKCLGGSEAILARDTAAKFAAGYLPHSEVISMPKRDFGPRPVLILPAQVRTIYYALVKKLEPHLPNPSRASDFANHQRYGTSPATDEQWLVDFDIAACYEYIDHQILHDELVLQTMDATIPGALKQLLGAIYDRRVGLPQAMEPSHRLSDAYLAQIDRALEREGYEIHRYADDFRIRAESWGQAHYAIERAADIARSAGLALADGKTKVRRAAVVADEDRQREAALEEYRATARDELKELEYVRVGYDDFEIAVIEPQAQTLDNAVLMRVVQEWAEGADDAKVRGLHAYYGSRALNVLRGAHDRVDTSQLVSIARREPRRLADVVQYVSSRHETSENWETLAELADIPRQGPWARLWICLAASEIPADDSESWRRVMSWGSDLLNDRHQTVRAEAAWLLAQSARISAAQLSKLYVEASDVTRPGIAACLGRASNGGDNKFGSAIAGDSPVLRAAYEWGMRRHDAS